MHLSQWLTVVLSKIKITLHSRYNMIDFPTEINIEF